MMALRGIGGVAGLLKAYAAMAERGEPVTPEMMLRWAGRLDEYHAELWRILVTERK
ncbi:hypothetical protein [Gemmata sp.]|uniref:hypothetical protein n=1 Tax=Gemmata sp. TaxID=1914242 RepID=UPI003F727DE2